MQGYIKSEIIMRIKTYSDVELKKSKSNIATG